MHLADDLPWLPVNYIQNLNDFVSYYAVVPSVVPGLLHVWIPSTVEDCFVPTRSCCAVVTVMETRFRKAVSCRASALPHDLWQIILSFLPPCHAARAGLVCSDFAAICEPAAVQACRRLWPQHGHRLTSFGAGGVQRFIRLVQTHEAEAAAHPDVGKAGSVQKLVNPDHRQIAVEWLIEVRVLACRGAAVFGLCA